ncbi:P-loop containing nucleoside triphosphate hydrolase protein [Dissophora ornata]|nr:P-loop containing nucleoside triphosphate hydrolase protein [Dissophora ornata]
MQLNPKSTLLATPAPKPLFNPEDYSRYERKLLGSIVDPEKIKTTFKNTIIPPETIQTLQTMITLPLIRPQLFSYGLLQNEFLSGLLLFGPPGTGKTLLAKAVAKESGARMLEIKASDIFDMYVGEGEKNVSAVFSLARKLSPCVVFLDEVDSIFRARGHGGIGGGGGGGNSSQREILNQFMVEWDGLRSSGQNQGIVVMASTNRPFELDDAVLRRMPRRILVDLPSEQAREQILKVYLGQEQLEDGVDIKDLAKKTGFFSGSDLKNLCVSAALTSVREDVEDEVRSLHASSISSTPVRVIKKRHFEKALAQITPSCSENMDSLTELRKWDGLYGDGGKGRRKVNKGIGFEVEHSSSTSPVGSSADKARQ